MDRLGSDSLQSSYKKRRRRLGVIFKEMKSCIGHEFTASTLEFMQYSDLKLPISS